MNDYFCGEKMKKRMVLVTGALILCFLSGCGVMSRQHQAQDSGSVLSPADESTRFKVVTFEVIGKGLEPEDAVTIGEAKLMAERAAVADGYRKLVEQIRGVYVDAYMRSGNGYVNHEMIRTHTQSWLRGAEVLSVEEGEHNITQARLQLRINFVYDDMIWWPIGLSENFVPYWKSSRYYTPQP